MTWSKAEGEHKDGAYWPPQSLESVVVSPKCVLNAAERGNTQRNKYE